MILRFGFIAVMVCANALPQVPSVEAQQKIAPLFEHGRMAERSGNLERALDYYEQALRVGPGVAEIWANKGLVLHRLDRNEEALKAFLEASRLKPQLVTPSLFAGIEYLQLGQPRRALTPLQTALRLEPHNSEAQFELSRAHLQLGQYWQAVTLLQSLAAREPRADRYLYQLGTVYLRWCSEAARTLTDGESGYGKLLRAEMSAAAGKLELAQSRYARAAALLGADAMSEIPLDPDTLLMRVGGAAGGGTGGEMSLAVAAWRGGQHLQSLSLLQTVLKGSPQNPRALYWLTLNCRALARQSLLRAVESDPDSWRAHWVLAETAAQQRDRETAQREYAKALEAGPRESEPRLAQVQYLVSIDRPEDAAMMAREGLKNFPGHAELNYELARLLLQTSHPKDALPHLRIAAADPALPAARRDLADAYAAAGDLGKAIDTMFPVLPTDHDGSLHYRMARWYRDTGQMEKSRAALAETARLKAKRVEQDQSFLK